MVIREIEYAYTKSHGNFDNVRIAAKAEVPVGEDAHAALGQLKSFVHQKVTEVLVAAKRDELPWQQRDEHLF